MHPFSHPSEDVPYVAAHAYGAGLNASPKELSCAGTSSHVTHAGYSAPLMAYSHCDLGQ